MSESIRTSGIEPESADASPFLVRCRSCGAPADFDIRNHSYKCSHCGAETEASSPLRSLDGWRRSARAGRESSLARNPAAVCTCPGCGAVVAVNEGEMSATCAFCGGTMARRPASGEDAIPEVVIPFVLTLENAQARLDRWLSLHGRDRCAKALRQHRGKLQAMFLPYRLVKGPVRCAVTRQGSGRTYQCGAYVDGVAINASKDLPNGVLDAMEPYDWSQARAFHWGYLSGGQTARFPDVSGEEMERRTLEELEDDCRPMVEKTLMTTGVTVKASMDGDVMDMPALLPVYAVTADGFRCFVNGQTGRVSVSDGTADSITNRWWLPAAVLSALFAWFYWAFTAASHAYVLEGPDKAPIFTTLLKYMLPFGQKTLFSADTVDLVIRQGVMWTSPFFLFAALLFIFRKNKSVATRAHIPATPACRASREGDGVTLVVTEGKKHAVQDSVSARPVFFESRPSAPAVTGGQREPKGDAKASSPGASSRGGSRKERKAQKAAALSSDSKAAAASTTNSPASSAASASTASTDAPSPEGYWSSRNLVPVRVRFYPPRRIARWSLQVLLTAFLPSVVCGACHLVFGAPFFPPSLLVCQFIWCMFVIPWPMSKMVKRIGVQVFDNPAIQRIQPDGTLVWMDKGSEESVFTGIAIIASPFLNLFERSWKLGCAAAMCFGLIPVTLVVGPMLDESGGDLERTASKGSTINLMEIMFANSMDLTREEWDALPQVTSRRFMGMVASSLDNLSDSSGRYAEIRKRIKEAIGEGNHLEMNDTSTEKRMSVTIPATDGHTRKVIIGASAESPSPTLRMTLIALDRVVPKERKDLVLDYLEAVQAALPWGGFQLTGKEDDHFAMISGMNVFGVKRIPGEWKDLSSMWLLDAMETVEGRVFDLAEGKSTDTAVDKAQMERLTKDFWEMATEEGHNSFDAVPDVTPKELLDGYKAFLDDRGLKRNKLEDGVLTLGVRLDADRVVWISVDSTANDKTVLLKGRMDSKRVKALSREQRRPLRNSVMGYSNMGTFRTSMDVETGDLHLQILHPLRHLKAVPQSFYEKNYLNLLGGLKAVEEAVVKAAEEAAEADRKSLEESLRKALE